MSFEGIIFYHECEHEGCSKIVEYDDEPKCRVHSHPSGAKVWGYSAYEQAAKRGAFN